MCSFLDGKSLTCGLPRMSKSHFTGQQCQKPWEMRDLGGLGTMLENFLQQHKYWINYKNQLVDFWLQDSKIKFFFLSFFTQKLAHINNEVNKNRNCIFNDTFWTRESRWPFLLPLTSFSPLPYSYFLESSARWTSAPKFLSQALLVGEAKLRQKELAQGTLTRSKLIFPAISYNVPSGIGKTPGALEGRNEILQWTSQFSAYGEATGKPSINNPAPRQILISILVPHSFLPPEE